MFPSVPKRRNFSGYMCRMLTTFCIPHTWIFLWSLHEESSTGGFPIFRQRIDTFNWMCIASVIYIYTLRLFPNNCTLQYVILNRHRHVGIAILRHVIFCMRFFFYVGYYTPFSFMVFLFYHPTCWVLKTTTEPNTVITMHCYNAFRLTRHYSQN